MKEIKYVIKDINSNKYLSPYIYGKHWVGIEYAQRYNVNIKKENNILDFVDRIWIEDKEVKLVKELLKIKDINPEKNKNEIIKYSYNHSLEEITFLLFENNNVRNNLIHDDIKLYNKLSSQIIKNKIIDF